MASNIKEQDETVVNRLTENKGDDDHFNNTGSLQNEHGRDHALNYELLAEVLRLGLPEEDENIAQFITQELQEDWTRGCHRPWTPTKRLVSDEILVNRLTENEADDDHFNNIGSLLYEHNRLNDPAFNYELLGDVLRLGLPDEDKNIAQVYYGFVNKMTRLHIATLQGRVDVVRNLIDCGAEVHAKDSHGCTALRIAAQKGDYRCLKVLIEAGSDEYPCIGVSCKAAAFDRLGASALITAFQHNHMDCVQELLDYGVDINAIDENGRYFRQVVAEKAIRIFMPPYVKHYWWHKLYFGALSSRSSLDYSILQCAYKLLLIGKSGHDIKRNGISEIFKYIEDTGTENCDAEIFKVFVLESYCIDPHIPRGLTTIRHFGSEYYNSKIAAILITCFDGKVLTEKRLNMNLTEYLLRNSGWFETLKFLVKCIPWVPHINSLATLPCGNKQDEKSNDENFVLPPNVAFVLECGQACTCIAIHDREKELIDLDLMWSDIVSGTPKYGRYPLKQPLIDLIDERISDEIVQLDLILRKKFYVYDFNPCIKYSYLSQLRNLKQHLWYEKIALNPPTLRQCCRYSLLKCLGPLNVENIRKLPLPNKLHSYLLFQ